MVTVFSLTDGFVSVIEADKITGGSGVVENGVIRIVRVAIRRGRHSVENGLGDGIVIQLHDSQIKAHLLVVVNFYRSCMLRHKIDK